MTAPEPPEDRESAVVAAIQRPDHSAWQVEDAMDEMTDLAATAGVRVLDRHVCRLRRPTAALLVGRGQAEELAGTVRAAKADLVLFDEELSAVQARNLESRVGVRVVDRTQLILDIFAQHAHTSEGRLQIELAQLEYARPRLRMLWSNFERQKGGIGLRGPGEQQLELDRRRIGRRIDTLRDQLDRVRRRRAELRRGRARHGWAQICLVGYTNAGKSTLLNALTRGIAYADDKLFATLDPTTRRIDLDAHRAALLTDTVGFIRKLPHRLVSAFRATLEEAAEADLLIHVIDASHPRVEVQVEAVTATLAELGAAGKPVVAAINKIDLPHARARAASLRARLGRGVPISARRGEGLDALRLELTDALKSASSDVTLKIPLDQSRLLARAHRESRVQSIRYTDTHAVVRTLVPVGRVSEWDAYREPQPNASRSGKKGGRGGLRNRKDQNAR